MLSFDILQFWKKFQLPCQQIKKNKVWSNPVTAFMFCVYVSIVRLLTGDNMFVLTLTQLSQFRITSLGFQNGMHLFFQTLWVLSLTLIPADILHLGLVLKSRQRTSDHLQSTVDMFCGTLLTSTLAFGPFHMEYKKMIKFWPFKRSCFSNKLFYSISVQQFDKKMSSWFDSVMKIVTTMQKSPMSLLAQGCASVENYCYLPNNYVHTIIKVIGP